MQFSAVSETLAIVKDQERRCLLIASIVRREGDIICIKTVVSDRLNHLRIEIYAALPLIAKRR